MKHFKTFESLNAYINKLPQLKQNKLNMILIGGCARTGKSTLAQYLSNSFSSNNINNRIISLDSWLISASKRKEHSTVLERYDCTAIEESIKKLLNGTPIYPPVYNPISRERERARQEEPIYIEKGVVIIEGVIALALEELFSSAILKIYAFIPKDLRLERLASFYSEKGFSADDAKQTIGIREKEEIPFIENRSKKADIIYSSY